MDNQNNEEVVVLPDDQADTGDQPQVDTPIPQDSIEDLRRQLAAEREGRIEAERRAQTSTVEAHNARVEKEDTDLQLVIGAIDTLSRDNDLLKGSYQFAMQNGDFARAAEIQQEMSANAAKLLQLENGKKAMQSRPKEGPRPLPPADPVEALASQLTPASAKWVRDHPDYARDPRLNRKMIRAHEDAVDDGLTPDTPQYFEAIERRLGIKADDPSSAPDDVTSDAAKVTGRRDAAPAAAPVGRGGGTANKNVVRLTAAQREMASDMGMTPEEYAKNLVALRKEGKMQ